MMPMLQLSSRNQASKTDDCHIGMAAPSLLSSSSSSFLLAPILDKNVSLLTLLPFFELLASLSLSFWPTFCFNAGEEEEWGQRRSCHIMAIRSLSQGKASALSFSPAATASGRRPFLFPTDRFVSETWGSIHTWRRVQRAINGHPTYWRLNPWVGKGEKKEKKAREALHNNGKRPAA